MIFIFGCDLEVFSVILIFRMLFLLGDDIVLSVSFILGFCSSDGVWGFFVILGLFVRDFVEVVAG